MLHILIHLIRGAVRRSKTFSVTWAQVRRVSCGRCQQPFVYLIRGTRSQTAEGWRSESDEALWRMASSALQSRLDRIARASRVGSALCPHCHRYQDWMVMRSRLRCLSIGLPAGAVLGACSSLVLVVFSGAELDPGFVAIAGSMAGLIGGAVLAAFTALPAGVQPALREAAAMTDSEWRAMVKECLPSHYEPARAFFERSDFRLAAKSRLWLLPFRNEVIENV